MRKTILVALFVLGVAGIAQAQCENSTLTFLTESVPTFDLNRGANFQLEAIGGTAPYAFEIYDGSLPDGLQLTSHGKIVGRPTEATLGETVFVRLTDSEGCSLVQAFNIQVEDL